VKEYGPCEAPEHAEGCTGIGSTKDHFTPKCIAKVLKWNQKALSHPLNIQWLSPACHIEKDSSTPARRNELLVQLNGATIGLGEHVTIVSRKLKKVLNSKEAAIVFIQDKSDSFAYDLTKTGTILVPFQRADPVEQQFKRAS